MQGVHLQTTPGPTNLLAQLQASLGDEYELEREMAAPPRWRVFIARERIMNRAILIKVIGADQTTSLDFERFSAEVERIAGLDAPSIVPPLMLGAVEGLPYIVTPYVPGVTLRDRMREQPPMTLEEIVAALRQVAESLQLVHGMQMLHHDLNPDTILLSQRAALLTDVGVANALRASRPVGSRSLADPSYLAPEQLSPTGKPDHPADLYAWGCIAYEMLTGVVPYPRIVRDGKIVDTSSEEPAPIALARRDVPSTLVRLIMRTLSREITSRPVSAESIVQVLQSVDVSEKALADRGLTPAWVPAVDAPTTQRTTRVAQIIEEQPKRNWRKIGAVGGAGAIASVALVAFLLRTPAPPEEPPLAVPAPALVERSTAVLPFALVGGSSNDAEFAAGLAVEIAQRLSHHGIRVVGTASARMLVAQKLDPRVVANRLGTSSILTGSLHINGDSVLLDVALLGASNGATLWKGTFAQPVADIFTVEDAIARAVAGQVEGHAEASPSLLVVQETSVPDAHVLLLQAHGLASQGSVAALQDAIARYRLALQRDSLYARAHASLALATAMLSAIELSASPARLSSITSAGTRALQLDSSLADAYTALGYVRAVQGANRDAESAFRRALARDSSVATTWGWYGVLAAHIGDYATGHSRVLRARTLEPASALPRAWDAMVYFGEGNYVRAEQATRPIPRIDSTAAVAVQTHAQSLLGLAQDSLALVLMDARASDNGDSEATALHAYTAARAGHEEQARDILLALRDASRGPLPPRATLAATLAQLGDIDSAIGVLTTAVARHDPALFFFNRASRFDTLRKDRRGAALFEKIERW